MTKPTINIQLNDGNEISGYIQDSKVERSDSMGIEVTTHKCVDERGLMFIVEVTNRD